jgi:hypothetical protein
VSANHCLVRVTPAFGPEQSYWNVRSIALAGEAEVGRIDQPDLGVDDLYRQIVSVEK